MAVKKLLIAIVAALALGGCAQSEQSGQPGTTPTLTPTTPTTPSPQELAAGMPFSIGEHEFTEWAPLATSLEVSMVAGKVINRGNTASAAAFQLTFYSGSSVLARFTCSSGNLQPGESEQVVCEQTASVMAAKPHEPPYDRITVEATS